jgi:chromosome segregation ATPase
LTQEYDDVHTELELQKEQNAMAKEMIISLETGAEQWQEKVYLLQQDKLELQEQLGAVNESKQILMSEYLSSKSTNERTISRLTEENDQLAAELSTSKSHHAILSRQFAAANASIHELTQHKKAQEKSFHSLKTEFDLTQRTLTTSLKECQGR